MTKSNNICKIWVYDGFHKRLKQDAALRGKSMIEYTHELAMDEIDLRDIFDQNKKKGKKFYVY